MITPTPRDTAQRNLETAMQIQQHHHEQQNLNAESMMRFCFMRAVEGVAAGEFLLVVNQAGFLGRGQDGGFKPALKGEFHVERCVWDVIGVGEGGERAGAAEAPSQEVVVDDVDHVVGVDSAEGCWKGALVVVGSR